MLTSAQSPASENPEINLRSKRCNPAIALLPFALALSAHDARAQAEWNQFRGPASRGIAEDEAALPDRCDPERNLAWKVAIPAGHSSPCFAGERIFVTGYEEGSFVTMCLEREEGAVLWRKALPVEELERLHRTNSPASATPATDGERVFAYFGSYGLVCYDRAGEQLWSRAMDLPQSQFGTAASPVLAGGHLILLHDTNTESWLEALDPETGETRWKVDRSSFKSGWSTPAAWNNDGTEELLVYGVLWLTAYDLQDGSVRWAVPGLADEPIVTPSTGKGLVFVSSYNMNTNPEVIGPPEFSALLERHDADGDGQLDREEVEDNQSVLSRFDADGEGDHPLRIFFRFLDADKDGGIDETEFGKLLRWVEGFSQLNGFVAIRPGGSETAAEIAWQFPRGVPECPSPVYLDGRIYAVKNGGIASCLDATTGELAYQERLGSRGPIYASPVIGDGKIYSASARGVVTVFAVGDELEVLAQSDLGERVMATPALVDGCVYVRTERRILAFDTGGERK